MNAITLEALKASIEKWERNTRVRNTMNASVYSDECPLCAMFDPDGNKQCAGCPVRDRTGQPHCIGSPWERAYMTRKSGNAVAFRAAARDEVAFLKSLLPQSEGDAP